MSNFFLKYVLSKEKYTEYTRQRYAICNLNKAIGGPFQL